MRYLIYVLGKQIDLLRFLYRVITNLKYRQQLSMVHGLLLRIRAVYGSVGLIDGIDRLQDLVLTKLVGVRAAELWKDGLILNAIFVRRYEPLIARATSFKCHPLAWIVLQLGHSPDMP